MTQKKNKLTVSGVLLLVLAVGVVWAVDHFKGDKDGKPNEESQANEKGAREKKQPVTKKPIVKQPVTKKPVTKKPVTKTPVTKKPAVKEPAGKIRDDAAKVLQSFKYRKSDVFVEVPGVVKFTLPDDNDGHKHQKWVLKLSNNHTVLIAHNIDLAPRVPLKKGDLVTVRGEFEYSEKGGVIHWTHHDPRKRHPEGWIRHKGKVYK